MCDVQDDSFVCVVRPALKFRLFLLLDREERYVRVVPSPAVKEMIPVRVHEMPLAIYFQELALGNGGGVFRLSIDLTMQVDVAITSKTAWSVDVVRMGGEKGPMKHLGQCAMRTFIMYLRRYTIQGWDEKFLTTSEREHRGTLRR